MTPALPSHYACLCCGICRSSLEGKHTFIFEDGSQYEGEWQAGVPEGEGTFTWSSGTTYTGEVAKGLAHGKGKMQMKDGRVYTGTFAKGQVGGGSGCLEYAPISVEMPAAKFEGAFQGAQAQGEGYFTYPTAKIVKGFWAEGRYEISAPKSREPSPEPPTPANKGRNKASSGRRTRAKDRGMEGISAASLGQECPAQTASLDHSKGSIRQRRQNRKGDGFSSMGSSNFGSYASTDFGSFNSMPFNSLDGHPENGVVEGQSEADNVLMKNEGTMGVSGSDEHGEEVPIAEIQFSSIMAKRSAGPE